MLNFDLRGLLDEYEAKTGVRLSYLELSEMTGVAPDTLKSLAVRQNYNATFQLISKLGSALGINPIRFMAWQPDQSSDEDRLRE